MFELPSDHTYLFLSLPFLIVWLALYLAKRSTRREQVIFSCAGAIIGPLSEILYFRDYWFPKSIFPVYLGDFPFMAEDVLFGFAIGGIGAVIFEVFFRTKLRKLTGRSKNLTKSWSILFIFFLALSISLLVGLNSIFASALALVFAGMTVLFYRRDLLLNSVASGICVMLVMFVSYFILFNLASNTELLMQEQWLIYGTFLDARFLGIPLTEMAWGFTWGFLVGPLYEFLCDRKAVVSRIRA